MSVRIRQLACFAAAALALLVVASAAPASRYSPGSSAGPLGPAVAPTTCHQYCDTVGSTGSGKSTPVIVRTEIVHGGFRWLDAAIGFGVACGLMLLVGGAVAARRRVRVARDYRPAERVAPLETAG